jgi:hypothetical protein
VATVEDIRGRVRTRLEEAAEAVWTDEEIDECVTGALEAYGWRFPVEVIATASVSDGATTIAAPTGMRAIQRVLLADGTVVPRRGRPIAGVTYEEQAWELYAGVIHFTQELNAQTISIWCLATPALADVPAGDEGLLVLGATLQALQNRAIQDYKRGGDLSSSDHVISHARSEYEHALTERSRRVRAGMVSG